MKAVRKGILRRAWIAAVFALVVAFGFGGYAGAVNYTYTDLGSVTGAGIYSEAYSINNNGQIVGWSKSSSYNERATIWQRTGGSWSATAMGNLLGGDYYTARAINDNGKIVGTYNSGAGAFYLNNPAGAMMNLASPGGGIKAYGVNSSGVITGFTDTLGAYTYKDGVFSALPSPPSPAMGWWDAFAINDKGQVAGKGRADYLSGSGAFLYTPADGGGGSSSLLPNLGSHAGAVSLNNAGVAVGWAAVMSDGGGLGHPVMWNANGEIVDLGTLGKGSGQSNMGANDINNHGFIVGASVTSNSQVHAFIYEDKNGIKDLNSLLANPQDLHGVYLQEAFSINDSEWIVGKTSEGRAFLLTPYSAPVPLPPGLFLLAPGLVGLAAVRRRFKK